jgi:hypothetical protein
MKKGLIVGGIALAAVVALIGWERRASNAPMQFNAPATAASYATPVPADGYGAPAPAYGSPSPRYYTSTSVPADRYATDDRYYDRHAVDRLERTPYYEQQPPPVVDGRVIHERVINEYGTPVRHRVVRERSFRHSAEIVGGSAAAGAVIGALAGGGKGAAIGALVGGGGGLVYDRATHKKVVDR